MSLTQKSDDYCEHRLTMWRSFNRIEQAIASLLGYYENVAHNDANAVFRKHLSELLDLVESPAAEEDAGRARRPQDSAADRAAPSSSAPGGDVGCPRGPDDAPNLPAAALKVGTRVRSYGHRGDPSAARDALVLAVCPEAVKVQFDDGSRVPVGWDDIQAQFDPPTTGGS